jgi:hypothetical protein
MPRRPYLNVLFLALAFAASPAALACDLCAIYGAVEAQGQSGKGFVGGFAEQFTYFHTFQSDGRNATNPDGEYLNSLISQLFVGYNFNDRIGVQFSLPIIYRTYGKEDASASEAGIGDASLVGNVRLFEKTGDNWSLRLGALGGVKFPTGSTDMLNPALPDFAAGIGGHDLTLGSGSYDGLLGTGFFTSWKRWFLTGAMQYAVRTEGDFDYQFANDWIWYGGPGYYLFLGDKSTLSLQAVVSGESKGEDTINGVATDDTAVTSVFLGPQLNYAWASRLSVQLAVDLPVSVESSGQQIVPTYRLRAGFTFRF